MSEARTSSHQMPHGLHHMPPSGGGPRDVARQVLAPALVGRGCAARTRAACGTASARGRCRDPGRGSRTRHDSYLRETRRRDGGRDRCDRRARRARGRARSTARRRCRCARWCAAPTPRPTVDADEVVARRPRRIRRRSTARSRVRARVFLLSLADAGAGRRWRRTRSRRPSAPASSASSRSRTSRSPASTTGLHGNHRAIERRLAASPVAVDRAAAVVLRDGARASSATLIARGRVVLPTGAGPDRVDRPARHRRRRRGGARRDDLDGAAAPHRARKRSTATRSRPGSVCNGSTRRSTEWRDAVVAGGLDPWLADSTVHLYDAVARGALADVSPDVERVLGRARRGARSRISPASSPAGGANSGCVGGVVTTCGRTRASPGTAANPGSPSRANAAHAVAELPDRAGPRRRRADELVPAVDASCRT